MLLSFEANKLPDITLIGQTICLSEWKLYTRTITEYEMILVYQGKAEFCIEEQAYTLLPGDFILICPNQVHSGVTFLDMPCRFYYTHFTLNSEAKVIPMSAARDRISAAKQTIAGNLGREFFSLPKTSFKDIYLPFYMPLKHIYNEVFTLFEKALYERNHLTVNSGLMIALYVTQIMTLITQLIVKEQKLDSIGPNDGQIPRIVQEAIFYLHEHYNQALTLKSICMQLGITPQYLIRLFQNNLGITPLQYLNKLRISRAKDLLRTSNFTMKEISYAVGLQNPHYFSRLFRNLEGISPTELKRGLDSKSNA